MENLILCAVYQLNTIHQIMLFVFNYNNGSARISEMLTLVQTAGAKRINTIIKIMVVFSYIPRCNLLYHSVSRKLQGHLAHFLAQTQKLKIIHSKHIFHVFSKKKFFLYFVKWNFLALRLKDLLYFKIPTFKFFFEKFLIFFLEKFIIFQEMELSCPKLKKLLYFRKELAKPEKQKPCYISLKKFSPNFGSNLLISCFVFSRYKSMHFFI